MNVAKVCLKILLTPLWFVAMLLWCFFGVLCGIPIMVWRACRELYREAWRDA